MSAYDFTTSPHTPEPLVDEDRGDRHAALNHEIALQAAEDWEADRLAFQALSPAEQQALRDTEAAKYAAWATERADRIANGLPAF